MDKKGFTLVELIIVVAIIGILAMIAIPAYVGQQKKAARTEAYANLQNLRLLEEQFFAENGQYTLLGSLTGWKPGPALQFTYAITTVTGVCLPNPVPVPYAGTTVACSNPNSPCFIATATGAGPRVANDKFAIDCNNNWNF